MTDISIKTKPLFTGEITTDKSICVITDEASGATYFVPLEIIYKFKRKIIKNKRVMIVYDSARAKEENYND